MNTTTPARHIVLVPGFWLGAWAWDDLLDPLLAAGLTPHPVTLPGLDPAATDRATITRDDQVRAVLDLVAGLDGDVVLVGHSGGGSIVQQVADVIPGRIARIVYVDTGPLVDGAVHSSTLPADVTEVPFPSWEEHAAQGASTEGIDDGGLQRLRDRAVPHPAHVVRDPVRVSNPARLDVPATFVCTSILSEMLRKIASPGPPFHTELGEVRNADWIDLPTGHWPMFSRPAELAEALVAAVDDPGGQS